MALLTVSELTEDVPEHLPATSLVFKGPSTFLLCFCCMGLFVFVLYLCSQYLRVYLVSLGVKRAVNERYTRC